MRLPRHTLAASLALLLPAGSVVAQTAPTPDWPAAVREALLGDAEGRDLRPPEAPRAAWRDLSQADRDVVLRDCAALAKDARTLQGAASGGMSDAPAPPDAVAGPDASTPYAAACALVEGF